MLRCTPVDVSSTACASLDGCSSSIGSRGSTVAISVLASNPFFVCWTGSHRAMGALAGPVMGPVLRPLSEDPNPEVRAAAITALKVWGM